MLDMGFDIREVEENSAYNLEVVKSLHDKSISGTSEIPFESLSRDEKWSLLHNSKQDAIMSV